jgi:hypothetical protein
MDNLKGCLAILATLAVSFTFVFCVMELCIYFDKRAVDVEAYKIEKLGSERINK